MNPHDQDLERELEYHERLYSGFAQRHFAKPAVRALREHMAARIVNAARLGRSSRVLSVGCGIGDTELLIAPHVGELVGLDLSPSAVRTANESARAARIANFQAFCAPIGDDIPVQPGFDAVVAVFFLHHLTDTALRGIPTLVRSLLVPGGTFYSLDPSCGRLAGWVGETFFPRLMARYQSPGEHPLDPASTAALFRAAGFEATTNWYDYVSTPLAGLFPSWRAGYRVARVVDDGLIAVPALNRFSSNFEILACRPASSETVSKPRL